MAGHAEFAGFVAETAGSGSDMPSAITKLVESADDRVLIGGSAMWCAG